jgi:large subunit ribosomal protein L17
MPQPKKAARFGGAPAHHNRILANLTTELIRHGRIRTTFAKAKTVQPLAERMITFGKRGDLHSRRQVLRVIRDKDVVHKLFATVGPAFAERNGGYTRVLKLGPRRGDAAPMALIELVEGVEAAGEGTFEEAPRRRWSLRRRRGTLSTTGRERAEERAAAIDRGEDLEPAFAGADTGEAAEAVPVGSLEERELAVPVDEEDVQVRPEDVEARFAAEDEAEARSDADDEAGSGEAEESEDAGDAEDGEKA